MGTKRKGSPSRPDQPPVESNSSTIQPRPKLSRLSKNYRIAKTPLPRSSPFPPPSSLATNNVVKIIYISPSTPFMAGIKRIQTSLGIIERRETQSSLSLAKRTSNKTTEGEKGGEVLVQGTGKAVGKVLDTAWWFKQRGEEYIVRLETGSVGVVDCITMVDQDEDEDMKTDDGDEDGDEEEEDRIVEQGMEQEHGDGDGDGGKDEAGHETRDHTVNDDKRGGDGNKEARQEKDQHAANKKTNRKKNIQLDDNPPNARIRYTSALKAYISKS